MPPEAVRMDPDSVRAEFGSVCSSLGKLYQALSDQVDVAGVLSLQEFVLLENLLKEYSYYS